MTAHPCKHCGDADALEESGLCVPCDRDHDLASPRDWSPLGIHFVFDEDVCGRPLTGVGAGHSRQRTIHETEAAR